MHSAGSWCRRCCTGDVKPVIAVDGVAPGVGKSTVRRQIVALLTDRGITSTAFAEKDVLTHPTFSPVAAEFETTGKVGRGTLLQAAADYLRWFDEDPGDVAVTDALFPFVASLLGWGHDEPEIDEFLAKLHAVSGASAILFVYLDDDPRAAIARAVAREREGWLEWLIDSLNDASGEPVVDLDSLSAYFYRRRDLTCRLLARHGWPVVRVEGVTGMSPEDLAGQAVAALNVSGA